MSGSTLATLVEGVVSVAHQPTDAELAIRRRMQRQSAKACQLLQLIVGAYCCCVFPPFVVYLLNTFAPNLRVKETNWYYLYPWLSFANSAINPLIYFFLSKEARNRTLDWIRDQSPCCDAF